MKLTEALSGIGQSVAYYPSMARVFGSAKSAILFSQLWFISELFGGREFYKALDELSSETGLSVDELRTARAALVRDGILAERLSRLEHRLYFTLDYARIDEVWSERRMQNPVSRNVERQFGEVDKSNFVSLLREPHKRTTERAETPSLFSHSRFGNMNTTQPKATVDELAITGFVTTFAPVMGGEEAVRLSIRKAINRTAHKRAVDKIEDVRIWLERDAKWYAERGDRSTARAAGSGLGRDGLSEDERWEPYAGRSFDNAQRDDPASK